MSDPLDLLVRRLSRLPGIGHKTALRLAFHILKAPESHARELAEAIVQVRERLHPCPVCGHLTESDPCTLCQDPRRDPRVLCVVARAQDLMAIERSGGFRGRYHVLGGLLSPLDGVHPEHLRIDTLLDRLEAEAVEEVILATSPNVEGDVTAQYIAGLVKPRGVKVSRIASGVPIGGDLEYADGVTLGRALEGRLDL